MYSAIVGYEKSCDIILRNYLRKILLSFIYQHEELYFLNYDKDKINMEKYENLWDKLHVSLLDFVRVNKNLRQMRLLIVNKR